MIVGTGGRGGKGRAGSSGVEGGATRAPPIGADLEARARELVTMAAHDLRSPLAVIGFRSHDVIQRWRAGEMPPSEEWASVVVGICAAADDASSMIDDLLTMERLDRRGGRGRGPVIVDVQGIIEQAIDREKLALERAHCPVTVIREAGLTAARGAWDCPYLLRVFGNLLRNAAHHAAGAPIRITLARRGLRLGIVFADRGPGMPKHGQRGVVERDGRAVSVAQPEVHGLGLWIVRRAVHLLHGRLRIRSRAGAGLTFDIELPGLQR